MIEEKKSMLNLSANARKFVLTHKKKFLDLDPACLSLVTRRQLEVVSFLFNFEYDSRCSFQDHRYRVSCFTTHQGETVREFLSRSAFRAGGASFVQNICTDETHEPDGLVLMPNGGLAIYIDADRQFVVYSAIEKVLERDALLDERNDEHVGTIIFKNYVSMLQILARLNTFKIYSQASDKENVLVQSQDTVCLLQWWHHVYAPSFVNAVRDCTMRIFSSKPGSFEQVCEHFDPADLICAVPSDS